jgi:hypothetical protein
VVVVVVAVVDVDVVVDEVVATIVFLLVKAH